jgi:hypothetical protein
MKKILNHNKTLHVLCLTTALFTSGASFASPKEEKPETPTQIIQGQNNAYAEALFTDAVIKDEKFQAFFKSYMAEAHSRMKSNTVIE